MTTEAITELYAYNREYLMVSVLVGSWVLSVWFCRNQTHWYGGQSYIGTTLISLTVYSSCVSEAGWKEQREWVNVFSTGEQFDLLHHLR